VSSARKEPGMSNLFLTAINPNQTQVNVKRVNRISYMSPTRSPPKQVEKVVEKPVFTLDDLVIPQETNVIDTEN